MATKELKILITLANQTKGGLTALLKDLNDVARQVQGVGSAKGFEALNKNLGDVSKKVKEVGQARGFDNLTKVLGQSSTNAAAVTTELTKQVRIITEQGNVSAAAFSKAITSGQSFRQTLEQINKVSQQGQGQASATAGFGQLPRMGKEIAGLVAQGRDFNQVLQGTTISWFDSTKAADAATKSSNNFGQSMRYAAGTFPIFNTQVRALNKGTNEANNTLGSIGQSMSKVETLAARLTQGIQILTGGFLAFKAVQILKDLADTAARTEVLGTVLKTVALNAGIAGATIDAIDKKVQGLGITASSSRQSLTQMIQAGLDVNTAPKLARAAQDLAVVAGENSSDTFSRLITNIQQLDTMGLRFMGIVIQADEAYDEFGRTIGKTANALTQSEKQQAFMNAALREAVKLEGIYEKSMTNVAKQQSSLARLQEELKDSLGKGLLPAYLALTQEITIFLKQFRLLSDGFDEQGKGAEEFGQKIKSVAATVRETLVFIINHAEAIAKLVVAYVGLRVVIAVVTSLKTAWLMLAAAKANIPVMLAAITSSYGKLLTMLGAIRAAFLSVAAAGLIASGGVGVLGTLAAGFATVVGFIFSLPGLIAVAVVAVTGLIAAFIFPEEVKAGFQYMKDRIAELGEMFDVLFTNLPNRVSAAFAKSSLLFNSLLTTLRIRSKAESERIAKEAQERFDRAMLAMELDAKGRELKKDVVTKTAVANKTDDVDTDVREKVREQIALVANIASEEEKLVAIKKAGSIADVEAQEAQIALLKHKKKELDLSLEKLLAEKKLSGEYAQQIAAQEEATRQRNEAAKRMDELRKAARQAEKDAKVDGEQFVFNDDKPDEVRSAEVQKTINGIRAVRAEKQAMRNEERLDSRDIATTAQASAEKVRRMAENAIKAAQTTFDIADLREFLKELGDEYGPAFVKNLQDSLDAQSRTVNLNEMKRRLAGSVENFDYLRSLRDAQIAANKTAADATMELQVQTMQQEERLMSDSYNDRKVTIGEFFAFQRQLILLNQTAQAAALKGELVGLEDALREATRLDEADKVVRLTAQIFEIKQRILGVEGDTATQLALNNREQERAIQALTKQTRDLQLELAASGGDIDAIMDRNMSELTDRYQEMLQNYETMAQSEDEAVRDAGVAGIKMVLNLFQVDLAKQRADLMMQELRRTIDLSEAMLDAQSSFIELAKVNGDITSLDADRAFNGLIQERIKLREKELDLAIENRDAAIAQGAAGTQAAKDYEQQVLQLVAGINDLKAKIKDTGAQMRESFTDSFANALESVVTRTKSFKDAMLDVFNDLNRQILRILSKQMAEKLVAGIDNLGKGGEKDGKGFFNRLSDMLFGGNSEKQKGVAPDSVSKDTSKLPTKVETPSISITGSEKIAFPLERNTEALHALRTVLERIGGVVTKAGGEQAPAPFIADPNAPRGIRNNNPGNLRQSADQFVGEVQGTDTAFSTFESPEAGIRAMAKVLLTYQEKYNLTTIAEMIAKYAPASENDTKAYVEAVSKEVGVNLDKSIDLRDAEMMEKVVAAIIKHENGIQPYTEAQIENGVGAALGRNELARRQSPAAPEFSGDPEYTVEVQGKREQSLSNTIASPILGGITNAVAEKSPIAAMLMNAFIKPKDLEGFFDSFKSSVTTGMDGIGAEAEGGGLGIGNLFSSLGSILTSLFNALSGGGGGGGAGWEGLLNSIVGAFAGGIGGGGGTGGTAVINQLFAEGGYVSGPGTGTSDSIDAKLSNGEYVMTAEKTSQYLPLLEAMRAGRLDSVLNGLFSGIAIDIPKRPAYAGGGYVAPTMTQNNGGMRTSPVIVQVSTPDANSFMKSKDQIAAAAGSAMHRAQQRNK